ncbi:hypothetical protein [Lentisalinibacter sediminis]|uniref:hypothetical protein n=1 Tax=Lentisalinibacter sediminis TaxID=2992237 RepID=UPI003865EEB7
MQENLSGFFIAIILLALSGWNSPLAENHVWVIGGGPNVEEGGVQIEYNVSWVLDVLRSEPGVRELHIYFGSGDDGELDIVELTPSSDDLLSAMEPLARVFGAHIRNAETYRHNRIDDVKGTTSRESLLANLRDDFSELEPGDKAFIIYNGHGFKDSEDYGKNTLRLWNDTYVTAREFEGLLSEISPAVPTRFIFAQCYSGGFARLIHPEGNDVLRLAEGNRCGFLAASSREESEGCASSTKFGDYRDYTTQFFAFFSGVTRDGETVPEEKDIDSDGIITLRDAHLFSLLEGYSKSLPRSTSETFLENWEPWYLRWVGEAGWPENIYGELAQQVAVRLDLPTDPSGLSRSISVRQRSLMKERENLKEEAKDNIRTIKKLSEEIRVELARKFPAVRHPYTQKFAEFLAHDLGDASAFIVSHPLYAGLMSLQDRQLDIEEAVLKREREVSELQKVLRLRKLGWLLTRFTAHAGEAEQAWFNQLVRCEKTTL